MKIEPTTCHVYSHTLVVGTGLILEIKKKEITGPSLNNFNATIVV